MYSKGEWAVKYLSERSGEIHQIETGVLSMGGWHTAQAHDNHTAISTMEAGGGQGRVEVKSRVAFPRFEI